ncbi:MAG TPA: transglycosylase SLT domain-containing protein [Gemmatimonadaceae bacterium]|nr:transglycosylase SLT domain-containing protein [Gemmatimonadaceae bacterium]
MPDNGRQSRRIRRTPPPEFLAPRTRRADERVPPQPCLSWYCKRIVRTAAQAVSAVALLTGGTLFTIHQQQLRWANPGDLLRMPGMLVQAETPDEQVERVAAVLRLHTRDSLHAQRVARALVFEGGKKNIDPALIIGVLLTEEATLNPNARSFVGARGLMQVMPFHSGQYGCASPDLFNIEANICHGVAILSEYMGKSRNIERALLRYNGCVRGTNTPNCHTYPDKVLRYSRQAAAQMLRRNGTSTD